MNVPVNTFNKKLQEGQKQLGLWLTTTTPCMAEIAATAAYDWLLLDGEHAPNTIQTMQAQLQAIAPYAAHPVVRPVESTEANVKQLLDIGAQTLLLPMIDTAQQAESMVRAFRYPPKGVRGVGASVARASRWGRMANYMEECERELCLIVQVESRLALDNLDAILAVQGIDGVFVGPADLGASLGSPAPEVMAGVMEDTIKRICGSGKAAGTLAVAPEMALSCLNWGASFVAIGVDTLLFVQAVDEVLQKVRGAKR